MKKKLKALIFNFNSLALSVVLIIAAFLRLYKIQDYMTFLGDEGRDVLVVYNILHGHLTLLGPTSSVGGFFLGPIYYYFMAPFLWIFNYNPVGPAVMVAFFGIATVFLLYKFTSDLFSTKIGILASFLYAISPLVIIYSHSSWNPNPLPFFSLLSLYSLYKAVIKNDLKLFFLSGVLLGISIQLHYLAIFLGAVVFFYILFSHFFIEKAKVLESLFDLVKKYFLVFVGFLIGWSPFLAFEFRHGFLDFKSIYSFIVHSGNTGAGSSFFQTIYNVFFIFFGKLVLAFPPVEKVEQYSGQTISIWTLFVVVLGILSIILLLINLYKSYKSKDDSFSKYLLIFLWFFVGISLFGFYKKAIYDYYLAFMFPLPFFLISSLLISLYESKKLRFLGKFFAVFLIIIVSLLNFQANPFRYPANRQLNQMRSIADFVMTKTNAKPFNFALISGGNSDHAYRYFFTIWNHPPTTIQYPGIDPKRVSVTDQLLVVCESPLPCYPVGNSLWEIAGFGQADIVGHWKVSVVEVYKLVHYKGK